MTSARPVAVSFHVRIIETSIPQARSCEVHNQARPGQWRSLWPANRACGHGWMMPTGLAAMPTLSPRASLRALTSFHRDQVGFVESAVRDYGDIFRIRLPGHSFVMVN